MIEVRCTPPGGELQAFPAYFIEFSPNGYVEVGYVYMLMIHHCRAELRDNADILPFRRRTPVGRRTPLKQDAPPRRESAAVAGVVRAPELAAGRSRCRFPSY
jgi:hypothetical protein